MGYKLTGRVEVKTLIACCYGVVGTSGFELEACRSLMGWMLMCE